MAAVKNCILPIALYFLSVLNLLFMHYSIVIGCGTEDPLSYIEYIENIGGIAIDVLIVFFVFFLLTKFHLKRSLLLSYIVTLCWSFSNVLYSRYFHQYLSYSVIGEAGNLTNAFMWKCVVGGLRMVDLFYIFSLILFIGVYKRFVYLVSCKNFIIGLVLFLFFVFILDLFLNSIYVLNSDVCNFAHYKFRIYVRHLYTQRNAIAPVWTNFVRGSIRPLISDVVTDLNFRYELSEEDRNVIKDEIADCRNRRSGVVVNPDLKNVIFIIVESYLAVSSDLIVDGKEVTPHLNILKRSEGVLYNGHVRSNITIGESADGQFIYMSGLLPLRHIITVNKAKNIELPGLPLLLGKRFKDMEASMIIPTNASLWSQRQMCDRYGFDRLYAVEDYQDGSLKSLSDEQVFDLTMQVQSKAKTPFFSVILTMSMHSPYDHRIEHDVVFSDSKYTEEYNNYLTACHYTDSQIGRYLEWLKEKGIYDESLIVIVADHQAHSDLLGMTGRISEDLPLYIINSNQNPQHFWTGSCNQLDVYTTLLDILGIESAWYGLGHTLLNCDYVESVDDAKYDLSEKIIRGDYFKKE